MKDRLGTNSRYQRKTPDKLSTGQAAVSRKRVLQRLRRARARGERRPYFRSRLVFSSFFWFLETGESYDSMFTSASGQSNHMCALSSRNQADAGRAERRRSALPAPASGQTPSQYLRLGKLKLRLRQKPTRSALGRLHLATSSPFPVGRLRNQPSDPPSIARLAQSASGGRKSP